METTKPIIELQHVSVCYNRGKSNEMTALSDISLQIFEGEYIVFLGPSGCGKSTLLYTIAGLESATDGAVLVGNVSLREIRAKDLIQFYRSTIGMIFQAFYLVAHLSARDNIILPKMFSGIEKKEREEKAEELITKFGISSYADRKPSMMSGGQQQRTAIARALMNDPKIILADEPVGNLDSKNAEIVLELLADIHRKEGKTIIQVTHNARDAHYADRVFYLKDGKIERVVANTEAGKEHIKETPEEEEKELTEFEKFMRMFPDLPLTRIKAKYITRRILVPFNLTTEEKIEANVEEYIKGALTKDGLIAHLDNSSDGAGLYTQRAHHIGDEVGEIVSELHELSTAKKLSEETQDPLHEQMLIIRNNLLDTYQGTLSATEVTKLESAIKARIANTVSESEFEELLDIPVAEGGIGLNKRTARKFAEEVALFVSMSQHEIH